MDDPKHAMDAIIPEKLTIGGIESSRFTRVGLAEQMVLDATQARAGGIVVPKLVFASNGFVLAKYHQEPEFRELFSQADIVDVDGMPLVMATWLFCKRPLRERVATTDFILDASAKAAEKGVRFFFLGGRQGVAEAAAINLRSAYPALQIVGTRHGYFSPEEEDAVCREIVASGADILWLGLGSPYQESFAIRNRHKLAGLAWVRTCGGLFDFYSGRIPRAPKWMQNAGVEWLYRVWQEPLRLGLRYLITNPKAVYHLVTKTHD